MSTDEHLPQKKRKLRAEIAEKRADIVAASPLSGRLMGWQQTALKLGARVEYARKKEQPVGGILPDIDQLYTEVEAAIEGWRGGGLADHTGRVADTERAAENLLALIGSIRTRAG